jgi:hypothetical protein
VVRVGRSIATGGDAERTTFNIAFCKWLERYAGAPSAGDDFDHLIRSLSHVKFTRELIRDEMNAR